MFQLVEGAPWCSAASDGRHLYVFGGQTAGEEAATYITRCDPRTETVEVLATRLPPFWRGAALWTGSRFLLLNGNHPELVYEFDPVTGTLVAKSRIPQGRMEFAAVWVAGSVYLFGGRTPNSVKMDTIDKYDPLADAWVTLPGRLQGARDQLMAATDGDKVFVLGGRLVGEGPSREVYVFDPFDDQQPPDLLEGVRLPLGRYGASVATNGPDAFVFGGSGEGGFSRDILHLDMAGRTLTKLPSQLSTPKAYNAAAWLGRSAYVVASHDPAHGNEIERFTVGLSDLVPEPPSLTHADLLERIKAHVTAEGAATRAEVAATRGEVVARAAEMLARTASKWVEVNLVRQEPADASGLPGFDLLLSLDGVPVDVPAGLLEVTLDGAPVDHGLQRMAPGLYKLRLRPAASQAGRIATLLVQARTPEGFSGAGAAGFLTGVAVPSAGVTDALRTTLEAGAKAPAAPSDGHGRRVRRAGAPRRSGA